MKKLLIFGWLLLLATGCKKTATTPPPAKPVVDTAPSSAKVPIAQWSPGVKGHPYQLSLKDGLFGFCDDGGPEQFEVASGKQMPGPQHCDRATGDDQSNCGDGVEIEGHPEGGKDVLFLDGKGYPLQGQSHGYDCDGKVVIVPTVGAVEVIDGTANKVAIVDPGGGNSAVIGSGWLAWSTLDDAHPLRLETVAKAMEHAASPKE